MLDTVNEFIDARGEEPGGERRRSATHSADRPAKRRSYERDGRKRGVQRAEQDLEMVGILMMIVMDPLPRRREAAVPHQRIGEAGQRDSGQHRDRRGGAPDRDGDRSSGEQQVGDDRGILKIRHDQLAQAHAVEMMTALPETVGRGARSAQ